MNNSPYTQEEIKAEIERRGLLKANPYSKTEIQAELKRRGLLNSSVNLPQPKESFTQSLPSFTQTLNNTQQTSQNIGTATRQGLKNFGAGIGQLALPEVDYAVNKLGYNPDLTGKLKNYMQSSQSNFDKTLGRNPKYKALEIAGEIAPSFLGGAGLEAASGTLRQILAKNVGLGAAYGALSYDPTFEKTGITGAARKALPGALYGGMMGSAISGLAKAPANITRKILSGIGNISPDELKTVNNAIGKTGASLGDIINSPTLKHLQENILPIVPLSGVSKTQINRSKQIINEGKDLINSLKVDKYEDNPGYHIKDVLMKNGREVREESRNLYNNVDKLAQSKGIKINGDNYQEAAKSILDEISDDYNQDLENADETKLRKQLQNIVSRDKRGEIKYANIAKSRLNDKAAENYSSQNRFLSGAYSRLANGLDKDIKSAINGSDDNELMNTYKIAQEHYKNNVAPFHDKDIATFVNENADSDTIINHFLKPNSDRANLLDKLLTKTSDDEKNAIAHSFLKKAYKQKANDINKELSPLKLVNIYNRLGDRTKNKLFSQDYRDKMRNYSIKVKKNLSSLDAMSNPKTGARNIYMAKGGLGYLLGNSVVHGNLVTPLASIAAGRGTNWALNSQKLRDLYLKGLLMDHKPNTISNGVAGLGAGGLYHVINNRN